MTHGWTRLIAIPGAYNIRDLGGYRTKDGGEVGWGRLWRADSLHRLDKAGQDRLIEAGLRTVIDLRTPDELAAAPSPFGAREDVRYHHVSLFDGLAPIKTLLVPGAPSFDMAQRYRAAIDSKAASFANVLRSIADADDGLVLFNCTAGKDRTGLIAAFVLTALDVDPEAIVADYAMTADVARPLLDILWQAAVAAGHGEERYRAILASEAATMEAALKHLNERHGGVGAYLERAGFQADDRHRLRTRLMVA